METPAKRFVAVSAFAALLLGSAVQSIAFTGGISAPEAPAPPPATTGNLFLWCSNPTDACEAYVAAVYDSVIASPMFCPPPDLTHVRILTEVVELIDTTPELREANAFTIIKAYLLTVYGCSE